MSNLNFEELLDVAEDMREYGYPSLAIYQFRKAMECCATAEQRSEALRQLGMCYEHMDRFETAMYYYQQALDVAHRASDALGELRAMRCQLSIYVATKKESEAFKLAHSIKNSLLQMQDDPHARFPSDAVWLLHGLNKALVGFRCDPGLVRDCARLEHSYLFYAFFAEKKRLRLRVWTTGWLFDVMYGWAPLGWFAAIPIVVISLSGNLARRLEQMKLWKGRT